MPKRPGKSPQGAPVLAIQQHDDRCYPYEGQEVAGRLLVASGDATKMFLARLYHHHRDAREILLERFQRMPYGYALASDDSISANQIPRIRNVACLVFAFEFESLLAAETRALDRVIDSKMAIDQRKLPTGHRRIGPRVHDGVTSRQIRNHEMRR